MVLNCSLNPESVQKNKEEADNNDEDHACINYQLTGSDEGEQLRRHEGRMLTLL